MAINLSILDFKDAYLQLRLLDRGTINLSILDFKAKSNVNIITTASTINLSILDFKVSKSSSKPILNLSYKSIHIGF